MVDQKKYLKLGQIYREHGVKGQCKFYSYSGQSDHLKEDQDYILQRVDGNETQTRILKIEPYQRYFLIHFSAFDKPEALFPWRKATLWIEKSHLERKDNEIFDFEWEGFEIFDANKTSIGIVAKVIRNPLKQLVVTVDNKEVMIPYVEDWVIELDLKQKKLVMELPEGLI